jgi:hypothetical protein
LGWPGDLDEAVFVLLHAPPQLRVLELFGNGLCRGQVFVEHFHDDIAVRIRSARIAADDEIAAVHGRALGEQAVHEVNMMIVVVVHELRHAEIRRFLINITSLYMTATPATAAR